MAYKMDETASTTSTIMAALSTLTPSELAALTNSLSSDILRRRRRLSAVLSSPILFSLTLHRIRLLLLPAKTALLANFLLSSLRRLTPRHSSGLAAHLSPRDLDAAMLLLFLCDVRHRLPDSLSQDVPSCHWRDILGEVYVDDMLMSSSGIGSPVMILYIEEVARCLRFVMSTTTTTTESSGFFNIIRGGSSSNSNSKVAAAVSAVVALPSVEVGGDNSGRECVICKDEMRQGRDVCQLPCAHLFHWKCVLPWLRNNNTCPCCRFQLPTDDVFGEIRRLWDVLVDMSHKEKEL